MTNFSDEIWMAGKLKQHGASIFDGLSTIEQRRERVRQLILANQLAGEKCGTREGKPVTFREAFEALYSEPLQIQERTHG